MDGCGLGIFAKDGQGFNKYKGPFIFKYSDAIPRHIYFAY